MELQQKEKLFDQLNVMAKITGETAPDRDAFFSFMDEPRMKNRSSRIVTDTNKVIREKIGNMIAVDLESPEELPAFASPAQLGGDILRQTSALRNTMNNSRTAEVMEKLQSMRAEKNNAEKVKAPEKIQTVTKSAAGPMI